MTEPTEPTTAAGPTPDIAALTAALEAALKARDGRIGWDGPYDHGQPPSPSEIASGVIPRLGQLGYKIIAVDDHRLAEARQQDGSALRAALERLVNAIQATDWDHGPEGAEIARSLIQARVADLAALPPSAPPALDVQRLAVALHDSTWACPTGQVVPNWCDPRRGELFHVSQAQSIAAEYARLEPER